tara:strand:+ start:5273 stop:5491 length:219 start_codon:yes stop_codon:yes gene_type:complete
MASKEKQSSDVTTGEHQMQVIADQLLPRDASQLDEVDQYLECATDCGINDKECQDDCLEEMKESAYLDVPSY